jgi:hypothetical protein
MPETGPAPDLLLRLLSEFIECGHESAASHQSGRTVTRPLSSDPGDALACMALDVDNGKADRPRSSRVRADGGQRAKCRDGAASWPGTLSIKPSPSAEQSPEEKDDEHNGRDTGLATAEIQCNEHQLHSNSLRPTQRRQNRIGQRRPRLWSISACRLVVVRPTNPSSSNPR